MRAAPLLLGLVLGLAALLFAWTRAAERGQAAASLEGADAAPSPDFPLPPRTATPPPPRPSPETVPGPGGVSATPVDPVPGVDVASPASPRLEIGDLDTLRARGLVLPVQGVAAGQLRDSFADPRTGHVHEALDILAPRRTAVLATDDGVVAKLFTSVRGGLTVYQFDPTRTYCYYYAHLDGYAPGLREGMDLRKGQVIGYVGTTGNSPPQTPHLHFAILKLGEEKRWWEGTAINPYPVWGGAAQAAR